ncbi:MAG TPA: hypothetical protein V6D46_09750 [Coleofasciculaceae cyanobacterium]
MLRIWCGLVWVCGSSLQAGSPLAGRAIATLTWPHPRQTSAPVRPKGDRFACGGATLTSL